MVGRIFYLVPLAKTKLPAKKVIFPTRKGKQQQREPKKRGCTMYTNVSHKVLAEAASEGQCARQTHTQNNVSWCHVWRM